MKSKFSFFVCVTFFLASCAPNADQLKKTLEENPEILVGVIEKHPEKVMTAIQKAAQASQERMQQEAQKAEEAQMEKEFQNPIQPQKLEGRPSLGPVNAPVTIVKYTDFQCPYCARGFQTMEEVKNAYGEKIRLVVKHLPLQNHPMARPAAARFEAIALQDHKKAWAFYSEVFSNQNALNAEQEKFLDKIAKKVGANVAKMKTDMNSPKVQNLINEDMAEAEKFGITGTPGFIVAGVTVKGAYPLETFKKIIDRKLAEPKK